MFGGSNPFGQSFSSSPFGSQSQSMFGQTNNASSNPFAPKPFGTSTPFGAQTGSSMFGGTSTGVFGAPQASSPFSSTPTFGAPSQGFGSSAPAFGASPAPAFGSSPSPFGGSSTFGQNSFGSSTPQSSPFGSTTQQSQPAFGNSTFGASNTPAFGATNTPAFGSTNTPAFGSTNTPAFGSTNTPAFGSTNTPAFGSTNTPAFGSTNTPAFGATSSPAFGATSSPAFGASSTPAFGNSGTAFGNNAFGSGAAFGAASTPAFGASNTPAFGAPSTPSFSFSSSSAFGQSTSAFGTGSLGSTQSPFGAQAAQASTPTFGGQTNFGGQQVGSRVMPYAATADAESGTGSQPAKLVSISAMPVYKGKSIEELRWEDYQRGDKGGQRPAGQSSGSGAFSVINSQPSVFNASPGFAQTSANTSNPFSNSTTTNPFAQKTPTASPFGQNTSLSTSSITPTVSPFGQNTSPSIFGSTSSMTTSVFGPSSTSQPFGSSSTLGFNSSPSIFNSAPANGSTPAFGSGASFNNSQSASLFSTNASMGQTNSAFGQNTNAFGQNTNPPQNTNAFGQNTNPPQFGQNTNVFGQNNNFSTPSTGFSNLFSTTPSLTTTIAPLSQTKPAGLTTYQPVQPAQPSGAFAFNGFGQTQPANTAGTTSVISGMGGFSQGNFGQVTPSSNPVANPFGTLPASPQMSIAQGGNSPSIQYGISSMPVVDKPAPVRISSLLTSRHLLQRRVKPPARKYRPGDDGPKVPFFSDEENSNTPKADALFIPRENPRALFIRPVEREKSAPPKDAPTPLHENGKSSNGATNGSNHEDKANGETRDAPPIKATNQKPNGTTQENPGGVKACSPSGADIESVMPKLHHAEYFTEPRIQELAAKERVNPGYCKRVRDFVVGRHGYGSIKFLGETDVRGLDLEKLVQFNNREVIVYMDESKKPPVGQGLNKPAEVTLLKIKCVDKKSGMQVKEGPRVEKYKEMLKRKAEEQGAKFVSFDAVIGEWKFRVEHFSSYELGDGDEDEEE